MAQVDQIKAAILNEDLSLNELEERYSEVNRWDLRILRSEVLKESRVSEVFNAGEPKLPEDLKEELPKAGQTLVESGFLRPVHLEMDPLPEGKPTFRKAGRQILVISDMHFPEDDKHAMDVVFQIGRDLDLDRVILNGDVFDCGSLSRFDQPHDRPLRWVEERSEALPSLARIRANFPATPIEYKIGNHDIRPERWIQKKAKPLQGLFSLEELLGVTDLGFEITREPTFFARDRLMVKHGTNVSKHSGYSAKREVESSGLSVIMGHTHRRGVHEVTKTRQRIHREDPLIGVESGCLQDLNPSYIAKEDTANWQHGIVLITLFDRDKFNLELIRINQGQAAFRGRLYKSRLL